MEKQKMTFYDLLTGKPASAPTKVDHQELWRIFLTILNARVSSGKKWLHPKEINVLSWILSQPGRKCYFSVPHNKEVRDAIPKLSPPELTRIKKRLIEAHMVTEEAEGGKVRAYPVDSFFKLRNFINDRGGIAFSYILELNDQFGERAI